MLLKWPMLIAKLCADQFKIKLNLRTFIEEDITAKKN